MRVKILTIAGISFAMTASLLIGCKKAEQPVKINPHSPDATMRAIMEQGSLLNDAMKRKDFQFIHDNMYYLQSLAKAFYKKLDAEKQEQLKELFDELAKVTNELDHTAGRRHEEATQVTMQRLQEVLKDLESRFKAEKKAGAAPVAGTRAWQAMQTICEAVSVLSSGLTNYRYRLA